jgi:hypothetical protein
MIRLVVDKVPLKYFSEVSELTKQLRSFKDYLDRFQTSRIKLDAITNLFSNGTIGLINGDLEFENANHEESIKFFNDGFEKIQEALKIGSTRSQTDKMDGDLQLTPKIKYELERRTLYCQTRITHAEALIILKESDKDERKSVLNLLQLAANSYQEEINFERQNDDFHHSLITLKNLFLVFIRIAEIQSETAGDIHERRNYLYQVVTHANKANFLGATIPESFFERTMQKIEKSTIEKFQERADLYWGTGLVLSAEKKYTEASEVFLRGQQLYIELQRIEKNIEFEVQSKIMHITALEHLGRASIEVDQNKVAVRRFEEGSLLLRKLISTVREMGNVDLVRHFNIQQFYYDGMTKFATGIILYDEEDYKESSRQLTGSKRILSQTLKSAVELDNQALIKSCKEGINKCESLLETVNLMIETETNSENDEKLMGSSEALVDNKQIESNSDSDIEPETTSEPPGDLVEEEKGESTESIDKSKEIEELEALLESEVESEVEPDLVSEPEVEPDLVSEPDDSEKTNSSSDEFFDSENDVSIETSSLTESNSDSEVEDTSFNSDKELEAEPADEVDNESENESNDD